MKEDSNTTGRMYFKDVGIGTLILEWILNSLELIFIGTLTGTVLWIMLEMLTRPDFSIKEFLVSDSALNVLCLCFLGAFVWSLYWGWKRYRLIKKEAFASVNDEKIMVRFGRDSFPWESIQNVGLESGRTLSITFLDKGEIKRRLIDLIWLSEKGDFIQSLMDYCTVRKIPYQECESNSFSRIKLFLNFLIRYPFV